IIGDDWIVFASDYSHFDSRFPGASEPIVNHARLSETTKRKILNDNAAGFTRWIKTVLLCFSPFVISSASLLVLLSFGQSAAENIKIGLPSVTITAMPFFVARDHGFFQHEGLNVEMVVMPASLNIKVLLAGDIQYAATIGSAVAAAIRGINVRTVMLFV